MQRIAAILVIVAGGWACPISAHALHVYTADFNLPIPSPDDPYSEYGKGWMQDAVINIPDLFTIQDIDVVVDLTHGSLFDLQIILQSPMGTNVLLSPAGNMAFIVRGEDGHLVAYGGSIQWLFDDQADVPIEQAAQPYIGPYQPIEPLSAFSQESAYGQWHLKIYDAWECDTGTLNCFELIFAPEPSTVMLLFLGTGFVMLFKPRRRSSRVSQK